MTTSRSVVTLLLVLLCTTGLGWAQDADSSPPGSGPALVQEAEQHLAIKEYDKALHAYEAADVWLQGKRLNDASWQPDLVAKLIRKCEGQILFLPKMIARDAPPHHGETKGYIPAWLAVENGFNLVESQQYEDALDRFEEADIRLQAIVETEPNWQPLLVNSRLKACEKELVQLPKLLAGSSPMGPQPPGADNQQPTDTQPNNQPASTPQPPTPQPLSDDGTPLTGIPSPTPSSEPTPTPASTPTSSNPDLAVIPSIPNLTLRMVPGGSSTEPSSPNLAVPDDSPTPTPNPASERDKPTPTPTPEPETNTVENASDPMTIPEDVRRRSEMAAQFFREHRYDDAVAYYKIIVAAHPDCANAWMNLGFVRLNQRRYDDAEAAMKKAHTLAPHDPTIAQGLETIQRFLRKYGNGGTD